MKEIVTYTKKSINPMHPHPDSIDIQDIAHALSYLCRGNGHVQRFYSVAQHCIACAKEAEKRGYSSRVVLACLLHDATEAYISDLASPLKYQLKEYVEIENKLLDVIYLKYLGSTLKEDEKKLVNEIDKILLAYDLKYLLKEDIESLPDIKIELDYSFQPFEVVEQMYLQYFNQYLAYV